MSLLEFDQVSCHLGGREVLHQVSWLAPSHGLVAVVGPNGAGKTTLVRCVAKYLEISHGRITVCGGSVQQLSMRDLVRMVSYVPQLSAVTFPFTVRELLSMSRYPFLGRFQDLGRQDLEEIEEAIQLVGVSELLDRRFHCLSGGERQKVLIAGALAQTPRVLLLDEPSSYLDPKQVDDLYILLAKLAQERQVLVVAVTHEVNCGVIYADWILGMKDGSLEFSGTPRQFSDEKVVEGLFERRFLMVQHPVTGLWVTIPGKVTE